MEAIEQYASRLGEVRSMIGAKSSMLNASAQESTQAAQAAKSETLRNLDQLFGGLKDLAHLLEGDFDAKYSTGLLRETAKDLLNRLTAQADAAVNSSGQAAESVKRYYLQDVNIRTEMGALRERVHGLRQEIGTTRQKLEVDRNIQRDNVHAARGNYEAAERAYQDAQNQYNDAQNNNNNWNKANDDLPWWAVAIPFVTVPVLISKGVMAIGQSITSDQVEGQRHNFESQRAFYQVQVSNLEQLEAALRHSESAMSMVDSFAQMAEGITSQCEAAISLCQATEGIILQAKKSLNGILGKCKYVQELVGRSDYTETKADLMAVIMESLLYGAFDAALVAPAKSVLQVVKGGDATHLLSVDPFDKQLVVVNAILDGLSNVVVLSQ